MYRSIPMAVATAVLTTTLAAPAFAADSDPLLNPHPTGCFAKMQHDWNAHLANASGNQNEIPVVEEDARGFEDCIRQEQDPTQKRSAFVGAEFAHVRLTLLHLEAGDRERAQLDFQTSYYILQQAMEFARRSSDVDLAHWATETSEKLARLGVARGLNSQPPVATDRVGI